MWITILVLSLAINNDRQFRQLAFQYYNNPSCVSIEEFDNDVKMFNTVANTIEKYVTQHKYTERLVLNRIIITHNMFGMFTCDGLFWKVDQQYWPTLKTYLEFLRLIPEYSPYNDITNDPQLMTILQTI